MHCKIQKGMTYQGCVLYDSDFLFIAITSLVDKY